MNRRTFIAASTAMLASASTRNAIAKSSASSNQSTTTTSEVPSSVHWNDVRDWGVEGRAFDDTADYFDRLPKRAKDVVRPAVWNLSRDTSGMSARFVTDSPAIYVRYALLKSALAMPHMPATGVSGLDLYGRGEERWHYVRTVSPTQQKMEKRVQDGFAPGKRLYQVYLPLYNGVTSLEVGVDKSASFEPVLPRKEKPILFYGTSITQGGCASRPGMSFTSILGRRLDVPMLNFGFSGNGRMELEVGEFLAELDPAIYVIDCSANCTPEVIDERAQPLVRLFREAHKETPILLVDERRMDNAPLIPGASTVHDRKSQALRFAFDHLVRDGITNLHFRADAQLLGDDGEATVDASHPTDLGMQRYADALEPDLRRILDRPSQVQ